MDSDEVNARYREARRRQLRSINLWFGLAAACGLVASTVVFCWLWAQGVFVLQALAIVGGCALALAAAVWGYIRGERVHDAFEPFRHN